MGENSRRRKSKRESQEKKRPKHGVCRGEPKHFSVA